MFAPIQPIIPLFQGNDYDIWSTKMRTLFISEDLWELVHKGYVEDEIPTKDIGDVRKKDAKALFLIQQAVADSTFPLISKATKSKEAWDSLRTKYLITAVPAEEGDYSSIMDSAVYIAAARGKIETLEKEISKTDRAQLSPQGNTILHIASEFGQLECVKWILALPASSSHSSLLQRVNLKGETALNLAAREGHCDVVKALINAAKSLSFDVETGLRVDKVMLRMLNKEKETALHEAVRHGVYYDDLDLVKLLIEADPDFSNGANASGMTPLHMAAEREITGLEKQNIDDKSTSPAYGGLMGRTALHTAVMCDNKEMTKTILEWKPSLTKEVDEKGWSPLHWAAERGCDKEIVKLLLEKSEKGVVYLKTKDENRRTALHIAAFHHHWRIVYQLLSHSPGCREQIDDKGSNVFHYAFMKKPDKDVRWGSGIYSEWSRGRGLKNEKNAEGNAPIHLLALNQISAFGFLVDPEVNLKAYNNENMTAYDIILRAEDDIAGNKDRVKCDFDFINQLKSDSQQEKQGCFQICGRDSTGSSAMEEMSKKFDKTRENKEQREKRTAELEKTGGTHLIVSALITTVTFAAGFTLPGGYDSEDGKAVLGKRAAFTAFVVTDTIAMLASLCAVFLHFFMTMRRETEFLEAHLVWAFTLTMVGMGGMTIAFATGLYLVLPHPSVLALVTCILCSCFFLSFVLEYSRNWRGTISDMYKKAKEQLLETWSDIVLTCV